MCIYDDFRPVEIILDSMESHSAMSPYALTPIFHVSDIAASFAWFERLGWKKVWDWGEPASFGAVQAGDVEIFLCLGGQGGIGHGGVDSTFGPEGSETADKGCWVSLWVDDVDAVHAVCIDRDIEVAFAPQDMPWGVRECHVRHPDGHVFRLSQKLPRDA